MICGLYVTKGASNTRDSLSFNNSIQVFLESHKCWTVVFPPALARSGNASQKASGKIDATSAITEIHREDFELLLTLEPSETSASKHTVVNRNVS